MSWSECWILFESRAEAYDSMRDRRSGGSDEPRDATPTDYDNWI